MANHLTITCNSLDGRPCLLETVVLRKICAQPEHSCVFAYISCIKHVLQITAELKLKYLNRKKWTQHKTQGKPPQAIPASCARVQILILAVSLLIQFLANAHGKIRMTQILEILRPTSETPVEFPASNFGLVQPWSLQKLDNWNCRWKISITLCPSVCNSAFKYIIFFKDFKDLIFIIYIGCMLKWYYLELYCHGKKKIVSNSTASNCKTNFFTSRLASARNFHMVLILGSQKQFF